MTFSGADALDAVTDVNIVVLEGHESICRRVAWVWNEDSRVAVLPVEHFVVIRHFPIDLPQTNNDNWPTTDKQG